MATGSATSSSSSSSSSYWLRTRPNSPQKRLPSSKKRRNLGELSSNANEGRRPSKRQAIAPGGRFGVFVPLVCSSEAAYDENLSAAVEVVEAYINSKEGFWVNGFTRSRTSDDFQVQKKRWKKFALDLAPQIKSITAAALAFDGHAWQWNRLVSCCIHAPFIGIVAAAGRKLEMLITEAYLLKILNDPTTRTKHVQSYLIFYSTGTRCIWRYARRVVGGLQRMFVVLDETVNLFYSIRRACSELSLVYGDVVAGQPDFDEDYGSAIDFHPRGSSMISHQAENTWRFRRLNEIADAQDECRAGATRVLSWVLPVYEIAAVVCEFTFAKHVLWKRS